MSRRRVLLGAGVLLVVLAGVMTLPAVRWPLWGWLRGERFYRGWPTSYYRDLVERHLVTLEPNDTGEWVVKANAPPLPLEGRPEVAQVYWRLGLNPRPPSLLIDPADADRAAPVLTELLGDRNPEVVANTAALISQLGPPARRTAPALAAALAASDEERVRLPLACALGRIDPGSDEAVRALAGLLRGPDKARAAHAALMLGTMGPGAEAARPALVEAVQDSDATLRVQAARTLRRIDPQAAAEAGVP